MTTTQTSSGNTCAAAGRVKATMVNIFTGLQVREACT